MYSFIHSFWHNRRYKSLAFTEDELLRALLRSGLFLLIIFGLHSGAMVLFEGFGFGDALWLTLTTATTVGYGDLSATTGWGRASTVVLLYLGGIFVLAKVVGDYFDYRTEKRTRQRCGEWEWKMQDHILIINTPREGGESFFIKVIEQIRANRRYRDTMVQILTKRFPAGLPTKLSEMEGVSHRNRDALDDQALLEAGADQAVAIIILAREEHNPDSDSRTFDILHRLREYALGDKLLIAECVNDRNRERFHAAGAEVVMRPIRSYPEMLVRGLVAPGAEQIIENMFTSSLDEYVRHDVVLEKMPWKRVVWRLMAGDLGTAVAYIDARSGRVETNPGAEARVNASAIFVMAREGRQHHPGAIQAALDEEMVDG
jgi:voltage-gated potassium channel